MNERAADARARRRLDEGVEVFLVAVDAAGRQKAYEVDSALRLRFREGVPKHFVRRERSVRYGKVDARQILVDDAPRAEVQMPHLAVPHLSRRETHDLATRGEGRLGVAGRERVHDGRPRERHGVPLTLRVQPPAVEDDEPDKGRSRPSRSR
jgi:hypothetical protein